jgi:hypothetical protein
MGTWTTDEAGLIRIEAWIRDGENLARSAIQADGQRDLFGYALRACKEVIPTLLTALREARSWREGEPPDGINEVLMNSRGNLGIAWRDSKGWFGSISWDPDWRWAPIPEGRWASIPETKP